MSRRLWYLGVFGACALALFPTLAFAANFDYVELVSDNRPANAFAPGLRLLVEADVADPLGLSDILSVVATPTPASHLPTVTLQFDPPAFTANGVPAFSFDDYVDANTIPVVGTSPFGPLQTYGQYKIEVTTLSSGTFQTLTHNVDNFQQIPFPTNLAVSNHSTTPIVSFTEPTGVNLPNGYRLLDQLRIFGPGGADVYNSGRIFFPSGGASFQVPPGVLDVGTTYNFVGRVWEVDGPAAFSGFTSEAENRSIGRFEFTAVPEPPTGALLAFGLAVGIGLGLLRRGDKLAGRLKAHA